MRTQEIALLLTTHYFFTALQKSSFMGRHECPKYCPPLPTIRYGDNKAVAVFLQNLSMYEDNGILIERGKRRQKVPTDEK